MVVKNTQLRSRSIIKIIRICLATFHVIFISIVGGACCLLRPFDADNTYYLGRALAFGVLPLGGLKSYVLGVEKFDQVPGPAIVISNHQDNFDAFIIGGFVPHKTVSIGKKIIRLFPFFGQIYWLSGHILIDRKRKKKAVGAMNQAAEKMKKNGIKVWVMPEGTRSRGRGLLPFKKGAFHLALQTGYPIIPVVISNYAQQMNLNSLKLNPVVIKVFDPIEIDSEKFDVNSLTEHCYQIVQSGLEEVDKLAIAKRA